MKRKKIVSDVLDENMIRFNEANRGRVIVASPNGVIMTITIKRDSIFVHGCLSGRMMNLPTSININGSSVMEVCNWIRSFIDISGFSNWEDVEYVY